MLGSRLKKLRLEQGLTQKQLGDMVNVTKVSICCYEKGERVPSLDTLIDLANALKVDLNTLVGFDNYVVSDNDITYGINISKEELILIKELRQYKRLYEDLMESPRRTIQSIIKKY